MSIAFVLRNISFTKRQFVVNHRYTVLQETEKNYTHHLTDQHISMLCFYEYSDTSANEDNSFRNHIR